MSPNSSNNLRIELEEIASGEFFIAVKLQNRNIAGMYLRGERQYANEFLEVARQRISLVVTDGELEGTRGQVLQELAQLSEDARLPRK